MARIAAGHFVTTYRLQHSLAQQVFRYLHGIGGGALAQVIAHDPAIEGLRLRFIAADAANKSVVLVVCRKRHRVDEIGHIVFQHHARGFG